MFTTMGAFFRADRERTVSPCVNVQFIILFAVVTTTGTRGFILRRTNAMLDTTLGFLQLDAYMVELRSCLFQIDQNRIFLRYC
jgi:hypothetical protein